MGKEVVSVEQSVKFGKFWKKCFWNLLPLVLVGLFYTLRNRTGVMTWWVCYGLYPVVQMLGRISALLPFSLGEALAVSLALFLLGFVCWRVVLVCRKKGALLRLGHLRFALVFGLWLWVWMCWFWQVLYYSPSFSQRSGLDLSAYPVEDLLAVTTYFAQGAASTSGLVARDESGSFAVERAVYFQGALDLYENLEVEYPFLARENVMVKSLLLSEVQSIFGFTGVYSPFTGEANINVHTPPVFHPVTIAHEMAHQRLVAPELEANFLAVAACLDSSDVVFQYSGYLFGLIQLSNSLYSVNPQAWQEIVDLYFTHEMRVDWVENQQYWLGYQSPVEEVAKEVYDGYLKSNDQELGIRSYGACVDLLVAYYRDVVSG